MLSSLTPWAGGPSIREVAKGSQSLLHANNILALASSPIRLELVGAVGIEPLAMLKARKLLSSLNAKKRQKIPISLT
jgi:hypothetical protein